MAIVKNVMIKAVFFDIDGTLLSYNSHKMLPGTIDAIETMKKNGIRTFISSGRPMILIPEFPVIFDGYITVNGGYCFVGDHIIVRNPIASEDCNSWLDYVDANGMTTMCFTDHEMYINRIDPATVELHNQLGFDMPPLRSLKEMHGKEVFQFIAMQPASQDQKALSVLRHCRMPRWHEAFTDVIPDNSSKAVGIELILSHFNISRHEAMAFGDGANDIEMLDYVGFGVAMGNASDLVKQHAKYITDDSDNEGIAKALHHLGII